MNEFVHKKSSIDFWTVTGEVLSHDKHSETHVSSYGGGGYVGPQGVHVSPIIVDSTVLTMQDIWIKTDDGHELSFRLTDMDVPIRPGQKVTVLRAKRKEQNESTACIVYLVNHSSKKNYRLESLDSLNKKLSIAPSYLFTALLLSFFTSYFVWAFSMDFLGIRVNKSNFSAIQLTPFFVIMVPAVVRTVNRHRKVISRLNDHVERIIKDVDNTASKY